MVIQGYSFDFFRNLRGYKYPSELTLEEKKCGKKYSSFRDFKASCSLEIHSVVLGSKRRGGCFYGRKSTFNGRFKWGC